MTDCERMADRMVEVRHGRGTWTAAEAEHLTRCDDCRALWRAIQVAPRVGAAAAEGLDPARIAQVAIARAATHRRRARWVRTGWLSGLAAAAALVLLLYHGRTPPAADTLAEVRLRIPIAELERLDVGELELVLDALEAPIGNTASPDTPRLDDLNDAELERLLRSMEG